MQNTSPNLVLGATFDPVTDIVSSEVRSRMMAGIKGKNTAPEIAIRKDLHRRGFRYRLHAKDLPGKPDIILPRHRTVVFVHGCFWHGHDCPLFKFPSTRPEFWKAKIGRNRENDANAKSALLAAGWRVATIWECAIRKKEQAAATSEALERWILGDRIGNEFELRG